ncbi:MAG: TIGR02678 family protein [Clostridiales bacterium]|jgi:uncharacterized protein (TIGR02678 family)|nr:TIGR02678 family protein [Clostridiales bacterium]
MNALEILLNKRWILKSTERDLYYKVKDQLGPIKKFVNEKLGYQIIMTPNLIKLEKLPGKPEIWMGIGAFTKTIEYGFLCMVLMFLEDKEVEEQFVLSQLTEYIQVNYKAERVDWTFYTNRRHLIRVLKFCVESDLMKINDGSEESFAGDASEEVLYENTGISKYFMRVFPRDIMDFDSPKDFYASEWIDGNEDRGVIRRQRVYRRILMSLGVYRDDEDDDDFLYIKNYRNVIGGELESFLDCSLQVHKTSAYLIVGPESSLGRSFPENNTMSDIILLMCGLVREQIESEQIKLNIDETIDMTVIEFEALIETCRGRYSANFSKTYRDKTSIEFASLIKREMMWMGLIDIDEENQNVVIRPITGKLSGAYHSKNRGDTEDVE